MQHPTHIDIDAIARQARMERSRYLRAVLSEAWRRVHARRLTVEGVDRQDELAVSA